MKLLGFKSRMLILGVIIVSLMQADIFFHEAAHAAICKQLGGTVLETHIGILEGYCTCNILMMPSGNLQQYGLLNGMVEVVAYLARVIIFCTFFLIIALSSSTEEE